MYTQKFSVAISVGLLATVLMSCEPSGTLPGGSGTANDYLVARQALETGNYTLAVQRYQRLVTQTGDAAGRLQLEFAHSLLRAGRFEDAIVAASGVISGSSGSLAASAMAVRGTARHQHARDLIAQGQRGDVPRKLLLGAQSDLAEFLRSHPQLDSAGAMAARSQMIGVDLQDAG
ncbi:MAG: hypothetical protein ACK4NW_08810 [Roseinatronobacter sp.]